MAHNPESAVSTGGIDAPIGTIQNAAMVQDAARPDNHRGDGGSQPTSPLHSIRLRPIQFALAKSMVERHHYLHSMPGGTKLAFGAFSGGRLMGALTFGAGPYLAHALVEGATREDCLVLTRLWLSDELPRNSESRTIGIAVRALRRETNIKFLLSYADPSEGHLGTIYQATGWLYVGLSSATPLYDIGDGVACHSRSLAHDYGSHSLRHFAEHGIEVKTIPQSPKHKYVYFLDADWRSKLKLPVLPYPKRKECK